MISIDSVVKQYSPSVRIGSISLDIPAGGITALVGPNGAGKSTLLTMIGRLLGIDEGTIEVGGLNVATTKSSELARTLSILRQENHFISRLTVRQLVGFCRFPHSKGRLNAKDEAIIDRYIGFLDLEDLQARYLDQLSGGQRQRAYVAMVLAQETDYVLLDEPLNNLDIARSVEMMTMLERAAREFSRTIVIVLHDINFAARYASQICALKDGTVAFMGTPEEIMRDEVLTDIFDTPVTVVPGPHGPIACYFLACTRARPRLDCHRSPDAPTASSFTRPWPVRMIARPTLVRETAVKLSLSLGVPVHVGLIVLFLILAVALIAGGLYLFASGLTARVGVCRPPLGLRLAGITPGSQAWERAHRAAWPIFFGGGVLGAAHGIALAATTLMDARLSVPIVFVVSGVIVEAGLWLVARGAGKASLS